MRVKMEQKRSHGKRLDKDLTLGKKKKKERQSSNGRENFPPKADAWKPKKKVQTPQKSFFY